MEPKFCSEMIHATNESDNLHSITQRIDDYLNGIKKPFSVVSITQFSYTAPGPTHVYGVIVTIKYL